MGRRGYLAGVFLLFCILSLTGCTESRLEEFEGEPDLTVVTPLTEDIYRPIIKEFAGRTGLWVEARQESEEEIIERMRMNRQEFEGDIVLGISQKTVEENPQLFPKVQELASSSFVIIYNKNLVIYNEIPEDFSSLLGEKWKGKIGFLNPQHSNISQEILQFLKEQEDVADSSKIQEFQKSMKRSYADSMDEINKGVCEGKYAVGVTTKRMAESMIADGEEIAVARLAKEDCIITNMTGTTLNEKRQENAAKFLSFTGSPDMKKYLIQYLKYEPSGEEENLSEHEWGVR